ncbi:MAG TPA: acyltransferase [Acidimicrobiales bacterium]|jgi:acetyltransferase-like isoleucine patch superfamily enzyme|nr:acyltransferase [Acidimicrobiales bacterium]
MAGIEIDTDDPGARDALRALVAPLVRELVAEALAEHRTSDPHHEPPDPLETMLVFGDRSRLEIDGTAKVNNALFNLSSGRVTVGPYSFFGHGVSVLTGSHDVERFGPERQEAIPSEGRDVVIGQGVWVASNATVVGPCRIGDHAVVGVGSVVLDDVEPYAIVAGSPAKVIRVIEPPAQA